MPMSAKIQQIDPRLLEQINPRLLEIWKELLDSREEVLRGLGREEAREEMARRMLEQGFSADQIAGVTDLSLEELDGKELRDTREEALRELGRKEGFKDVAQRMLKQDFSVDQIAGVTGLSLEELEALL